LAPFFLTFYATNLYTLHSRLDFSTAVDTVGSPSGIINLILEHVSIKTWLKFVDLFGLLAIFEEIHDEIFLKNIDYWNGIFGSDLVFVGLPDLRSEQPDLSGTGRLDGRDACA